MTSVSFDQLKVQAQVFMSKLLMGDFASATSQFDDHMNAVLGKEMLMESWKKIIQDAGNLLQMDVTGTNEIESHRVVIIRCQFQMAIIDVQMVFNTSGQISGLNFIPTATQYNPPDYVNESTFHEVDMIVGEGKWALPGKLTLPNGSSPFPCVVLVHGSGPNDMDETIGPNKTFRDLAWGLASRGIAVLRYNKRTLEHTKQLTPDLVQEMTIKEEVIDDALFAIQLIHQRDDIDKKRVFLLGHSLGATFAPRIGQHAPKLAGLIMMAGSTRSLEKAILDQFTYIYNLSGDLTEEQKAELEALKVKVDKLKEPRISKNITPQDLPLGIPVDYWLDYREHNPVDAVKTIKIPLLILQGERDYQVLATEDFEGWKTALKGKNNATFKLFPKLNHLFIYGESKSTPQEYLVEGHVDEEVINTISQWIEDKG